MGKVVTYTISFRELKGIIILFLAMLAGTILSVLVYCRSGNRSREASGILSAQGYTNIVEFGGINTWPGEVVTD